MGLFDKFALPNQIKKKTLELNSPKYSPIIGQASTFKTLASFDLDIGTPRYEGDIPNAVIRSYEDFK
ncbi:MAG: hypothetical protein IKI57_02410 [Clostridia bacterium]|nr:hypothetical protein [Clostridia bacterium]